MLAKIEWYSQAKNIKLFIMKSIKDILPWEERPVGCKDVMWRYSKNPIIDRYHIPTSNSIFNSAVVPFEDGYAGVFRCDNKAVQMNIFAGFSKDGINWDINHEPIKFEAGNTEMIESEYKYDPRVTWIEDRYWITWCNGYHGPTIGIAYTFDFKKFYQCENAFLPFNRNGVLFPEKINGKYAMLSRPSDNGHTPFGDIYISFSPDMKYWGEHRCVMVSAIQWVQLSLIRTIQKRCSIVLVPIYWLQQLRMSYKAMCQMSYSHVLLCKMASVSLYIMVQLIPSLVWRSAISKR